MPDSIKDYGRGAHVTRDIGSHARGTNDSASRNPPDPDADDLPGAHHQADEVPGDLPELVDETLHGPPPPIRGGMSGLKYMGLWVRGLLKRPDDP